MATYGAALEALADPTRRVVFERVAERPRPVGEIALGLPVSRPAVSQHLRVLKVAGLVRDRAVGTRRIYEVDPAGVAAVRAYLDQFWTSTLQSFADAAEADQEERP